MPRKDAMTRVSTRLLICYHLEVESILPDKGGYSREYSGEWIIIKNKLFYDFDGTPYNVITVGKNYVIPDATYALKDQVI
jgi:hypothetical protein